MKKIFFWILLLCATFLGTSLALADSAEIYVAKVKLEIKIPAELHSPKSPEMADISIKCFGYGYFDENKTSPHEAFSYNGKCDIHNCQLELELWQYRTSYEYCDAYLSINGKKLEAKKFVNQFPLDSGFCQSIDPLRDTKFQYYESNGKYFIDTKESLACEENINRIFYPQGNGRVDGDYLCDSPENRDAIDRAKECPNYDCGYGYAEINGVLYRANSKWYECVNRNQTMHENCRKLLQEIKPKFQYNSQGKVLTHDCRFFLDFAYPGSNAPKVKFLEDEDVYTEMVFYPQIDGRPAPFSSEIKITCNSFDNDDYEYLGGNKEAKARGSNYGVAINGSFMIPPFYEGIGKYYCDMDITLEQVGGQKINKFYQTGAAFDWQRNGVDCFEIFPRKNSDGTISSEHFDIETVKYQRCREEGGTFSSCKKYMVEYLIDGRNTEVIYKELAAGRRAQACKLVVEFPGHSFGITPQEQEIINKMSSQILLENLKEAEKKGEFQVVKKSETNQEKEKGQIYPPPAPETKVSNAPPAKSSIWKSIACFFQKLFGGRCQ